jgi:hypothetical protein
MSALVGSTALALASRQDVAMSLPIDDRRAMSRGPGSDRRILPRVLVLLSATLETPDGDQAVKLRNLSSTGARIETDRPPPIGTLVTFRRGTTVAPGTVVWATPSSIGIEFIRPIHQSEVLVHIRKPGPGS